MATNGRKKSGKCDVEEGELRSGPWTLEEDTILMNYVACHGEGRWNMLARCSGLKRTGKSCRLRWLNYLKPDVKHGNLTPEEQLLILDLHSKWGNRWSRIAQHLPGRTDNEIKNYWRTRVQKQARQLQCDANSQAFRDTLRCFWMPRLLRKMGHDHDHQSNSLICINQYSPKNSSQLMINNNNQLPDPEIPSNNVNNVINDSSSSPASSSTTTTTTTTLSNINTVITSDDHQDLISTNYNITNSTAAGFMEYDQQNHHLISTYDYDQYYYYYYYYYSADQIHDQLPITKLSDDHPFQNITSSYNHHAAAADSFNYDHLAVINNTQNSILPLWNNSPAPLLSDHQGNWMDDMSNHGLWNLDEFGNYQTH